MVWFTLRRALNEPLFSPMGPFVLFIFLIRSFSPTSLTLQEFDAVVGDITITASRSDYVDFTYQYMEAGVSMIVPVRDDDPSIIWWYMKPLETELWAATFACSVLKGFLVWFFEHRDNKDFQGSDSWDVVGKVIYFSFSAFVFANCK